MTRTVMPVSFSKLGQKIIQKPGGLGAGGGAHGDHLVLGKRNTCQKKHHA
jgi:hypothetical protein